MSLSLCSCSCSSNPLVLIFDLPVLLSFHLYYYLLFPLFTPISRDLRKGSLDIISLLPLPSCCFLNFAIFLHWIAFPFLPCGLKCLLSTRTIRASSGLLTAKLKGDLFLLTLENHILPGHRSVFLFSRPPQLLISLSDAQASVIYLLSCQHPGSIHGILSIC